MCGKIETKLGQDHLLRNFLPEHLKVFPIFPLPPLEEQMRCGSLWMLRFGVSTGPRSLEANLQNARDYFQSADHIAFENTHRISGSVLCPNYVTYCRLK